MTRVWLMSLCVLVIVGGVANEWHRSQEESATETLARELREIRDLSSAVDRLALAARSSASYDALVDTLKSLEAHEASLVVPGALAKDRREFKALLEQRAHAIARIKHARAKARNTERYLLQLVALEETPLTLLRPLASFLLVPDTTTSTALKGAVAGPAGGVLTEHIRHATETRLDLDRLSQDILERDLARLASKLEDAHGKLRWKQNLRARNIRLGHLTALAILLWFAIGWRTRTD